jgi:CMP-N,N'-diacetyllegionaminic acid synthase
MKMNDVEIGNLSLLIVIPARGGSKGIKKKNLQKIDGMTLVARSIESAKFSSAPTVIVVSTDDIEIMEEAKAMGALVVTRPAALCDDNSPTESAMEHALVEMSKHHHFSHIVLLQPTSPIRRKFLIDEVINKLVSDGADSIVGVAKRSPFFWKGSIDDAIPLFSLSTRPMRQNLNGNEYFYQETGNIYISKIENFKKTKCRLSGRISLFINTENEALDIDTAADLQEADRIVRNLK